jgi:hypothetical protein
LWGAEIAMPLSPSVSPISCSQFSGRLARLNLVQGFSKLARSVLRHIRVASKRELKDRFLAAIAHINRHPVIHTWTSKLDGAA